MKTTFTPNQIEIVKQIGSEQAVIYIALVMGPEQWNYISHGLLQNALKAGAKRDSLEPSIQDSFYHEFYSVRMLVVPWEMRGTFVDNVKNTLAELGILEHATIAMGNADGAGVILHGDNLMGTPFQQVFLRPEFLSEYQTEFAARKQRSRAWFEARLKAYNEEKQKRAQAAENDHQQ